MRKLWVFFSGLILAGTCQLSLVADWKVESTPPTASGEALLWESSLGELHWVEMKTQGGQWWKLDENQNFVTLESPPLSVQAISEDPNVTGVPLLIADNTLWSQKNSTWEAVLNLPTNMVNPKLIPWDDGVGLAYEGNFDRLSSTNGVWERQSLWTQAELRTEVTTDENTIVILWLDPVAEQLGVAISWDRGSNFRESTLSSVSSDTRLGPVVLDEQAWRFMIYDNGSLRKMSSTDGGFTWQSSVVSHPLDSVDMIQHRSVGGMDILLLSDSDEWSYGQSIDLGTSFRYEASDISGSTPSLLLLRQTGEASVITDTQDWSVFNDTLSLFPIDELRTQNESLGASVEWNEHPLATSYAITVDGVDMGFTDTPPYRLGNSLVNGQIVALVASNSNGASANISQPFSQNPETTSELTWEAGFSIEGFHMISFPSGSTVPTGEGSLSPQAYMESLFGKDYDPTLWRLGRWNSTSQTYDSLRGGSLLSGSSYWLISVEDLNISLRSNPSLSGNTLIRLLPGWNMIGNPNLQALDWGTAFIQQGFLKWTMNEALTDARAPVLPQLWEWEDGDYVESQSMEMAKGYWARNLSSIDAILVFPSQPSGSGKSISLGKSTRPKSDEKPPLPPGYENLSESSGSGGGGCLFR